MSKIFAFLLLLCVDILAAPKWEFSHNFSLYKDEFAHIYAWRKGTSEQNEDEFYFRWTLYDKTNIILHTSYRGFPRQYTLSLRRGLEGLKVPLTLTGIDLLNQRVELYLYFVSFDEESKLARFEVYISDPAKRVDIRYKDPREEVQ